MKHATELELERPLFQRTKKMVPAFEAKCSKVFSCETAEVKMKNRNERLRVVDALLSKSEPSAVLFQDLKLDKVGAKACCLLLKSAIKHQHGGYWELCHEAALKAREYAWEQLHR